MRTPIAAGNWKMQYGPHQAGEFATLLRGQLDGLRGVEVVVIPPYIALDAVSRALAGSTLQLGAQNCSDQPGGAYTGEIAARMIAELGDWVILGHSERRGYYGETDELVLRKAQTALAAGLRPIICVGERLEEREANLTERVLSAQVRGSVLGLREDQIAQVTVAYEPIWAIGTGRAATPQDADDAATVIRALLGERYGDVAAQAVRILYGGSVTAANIGALMASPQVDGGLIGGASLKPEFVEIARSIAAARPA